MRGRLLKLLYLSHIWLGIGAGLLLLLLSISGSLAVFRVDIGQWAHGALPAPSTACALTPDAALARLREELDGSTAIRRLSLPALTGGYYELRLKDGARAAIDPCGALLGGDRAQVGDYFVNLHTRLFMGKSGRWIVGGIGLLMLGSILTGVLTHRKLFSQLFTWRRQRSLRLRLSDSHKLLGVWLLPFHLLIAASGAWLGLSTLLPGGGAAKGASATPAPSYTAAPELEPLLARARAAMPGLTPVFIDFFPERGHVSVRGNLPGHLAQRHRAEVLFDARGAVLGRHDPRELPGGAWLSQAMMPLHLGDWSGAAVRWLYFACGIGTSLLIWYGLRLWAERLTRAHGSLWRKGKAATIGLTSAAVAILGANLLPPLFKWMNLDMPGLGATAFLVTFGVVGLAVGLSRLEWRKPGVR